MWVLHLNPMTANAEQVVPVAVAETEQDLITLMEREAVEPYTDGQWRKGFKQGGILEWFNPPMDGYSWINTPAVVDIGTEADWVNDSIEVAKRRWQDLMSQVAHV
jgi:hypothetical protein